MHLKVWYRRFSQHCLPIYVVLFRKDCSLSGFIRECKKKLKLLTYEQIVILETDVMRLANDFVDGEARPRDENVLSWICEDRDGQFESGGTATGQEDVLETLWISVRSHFCKKFSLELLINQKVGGKTFVPS